MDQSSPKEVLGTVVIEQGAKSWTCIYAWLMITPTSFKPFKIVLADTFQVHGQKCLTIIDTLSKCAQIYFLINISGVEAVKSFLIFMIHHGLPSIIIMDRDKELKNSVAQEFVPLHKIPIH